MPAACALLSLVSLFISSFSVFIPPSALLFPALYQHLLVQHVSPSHHSPPTSLRYRLVEACLVCTVSTGQFSLLPSLLFFTSVQAGGALLSRLAFSWGITSQRRGLSGAACRQSQLRGPYLLPPSLMTPSCYCLLMYTQLMSSYILTHALLGMI